jgi:hypothetical protein
MWAIAGIGLVILIAVLRQIIQVERKNTRGNKDESTKF